MTQGMDEPQWDDRTRDLAPPSSADDTHGRPEKGEPAGPNTAPPAYVSIETASSAGPPPAGAHMEEQVPDGPIRPGQVLFGRYEVLRKLGNGGMGEVWMVCHRELNSIRALKLILPRFAIHQIIRVRFSREARVMAKFTHPNIVVVHDARLSGDAAFIEMEYVRGQSLNKLLRPGVPMPLDWVGRILDQLCDALHAAHENQIVHRDLKPSNLMLVDGRPPGEELLKVLDFGIAKILGPDDWDSDSRTVTDDFIGTVQYASPEQLLGLRVDGRSDIYSTGVMLYEMLTGSRPFSGTAMEQMHSNPYLPPPPMALKNPQADVATEVERVVLRCLAKDPAQRPQSPRELAEEFRAALVRTTPNPPRRHRRVLIVGMVGILITLIACLATVLLKNALATPNVDRKGPRPFPTPDSSVPRPAGDRPLFSKAMPGKPTTPPEPGSVSTAAQVKQIFRAHCLECHGGKIQGAIAILDRDLLLKKKAVVPGKPDDSPLLQLVTAEDETAMPPMERPRLHIEEIDVIRAWIAEGATPFPPDVPLTADPKTNVAFNGNEYVFATILQDVRTLSPSDRPFARYFSLNHLLAGGATADELDLHRDALAKAINHLSWQKAPVRPRPIDRSQTVYGIDLRTLGWDQQPFEIIQDRNVVGPSPVNLFDLALLEYPYATLDEASETSMPLASEFLGPAGLVRPIAFVRADWFVSVATQPPLYEDFLRLPFELKELEARFDLDATRARRAGLSVSGVSRNNRVVERHPTTDGAYWVSFDFRSSAARENLFRDPIDLNPAGREVLFNLPNGLQGYFLADAQGNRLESAPPEIVTDRFAADHVVRNGLSCIRCHAAGVNDFTDAVRPAVERLSDSPNKARVLRLYPAQDEMDALLQEDTRRFTVALTRALGRPPGREPLIEVSRRFLDGPLSLSAAASELGLAGTEALRPIFRSLAHLGLAPLASGGVVRRDTWEEAYEPVVRHLGLGAPAVPLDGVTRRDIHGSSAEFDVELRTNKPNNGFEPGDELVIIVANSSSRTLHIELIGTSVRGRKVLLTPSPTPIPAGQEYRTEAIKIQDNLGREQITVFACDTPFPAGVLLRGRDVTDRVVHPFPRLAGDDTQDDPPLDPTRMVKKTITIETR
jgi:serine/threonine protein kinase